VVTALATNPPQHEVQRHPAAPPQGDKLVTFPALISTRRRHVVDVVYDDEESRRRCTDGTDPDGAIEGGTCLDAIGGAGSPAVEDCETNWQLKTLGSRCSWRRTYCTWCRRTPAPVA
jgi:hypothetical protein